MAELIQSVGRKITKEQNERRRREASPEAMAAYDQQYNPPANPKTSDTSGAASNPLEWFQDNVMYPERKAEFEAQRRPTPYGPGGSPTGSGEGQARQGVRPSRSSIDTNFIDMATDVDPLRPDGAFRGPGRRQKWNKETQSFVDVNVVHNSQPAVLKGQQVRADGKGNWINAKGAAVGKYKVGEDRRATPPVTTPPVTTPPVETASEVPPTDKPPVVPTGDVKPPTPPVVPETSSVVTGTDTSRSRRDDVRNAGYNTARGALTAESSAADRNAVLDQGMAAWAAANPELAAKVRQSKTKQSGYDAIMGGPATETQMAGYDKEETFKPSDLKEGDRQNPSNYFAGTFLPGQDLDNKTSKLYNMQATTTMEGREITNSSLDADAEGAKSTVLEGQRQLTPGSEVAGGVSAGQRMGGAGDTAEITNNPVAQAAKKKAGARLAGNGLTNYTTTPPADLSGAAGQQYLKDLDARKFTR